MTPPVRTIVPTRWATRGLPGVLLAALITCTPAAPEPVLEVTPDPVPEVPISSPARLRDALDQATGGQGSTAQLLRDVRLMLTAEDLEVQGKGAEATKVWFEALTVARGRFGQKAFAGWVKSYVSTLGKKSDRAVLTRLILAETQNGQRSPYMADAGLTTDVAVAPVLAGLVPTWLDDGGVSPAVALPPVERGVSAADPLLTKAAASQCASTAAQVAPWQEWVGALPPDVRTYFEGLVAQCSKSGDVGDKANVTTALAKFKDAYPRLGKNVATRALAIEAASRAAATSRALGQRTEAADLYLDLMALWAMKGEPQAESFGVDGVTLSLRRADETLMAANYRALVGDYETAKNFAQDVLTQISNAYAVRASLGTAAREQLAARRAEAYHVLAYRIAVEVRDFDGAGSLMLLALQTPNLDRAWTERLTWFAGFYDYLSGRYDSSRKRWEALLTTSQDGDMRAMLYFWLAKVYDRLGQDAESRFYLAAVVEDYPLSYYATVAPAMAGMSSPKTWMSVFGDLSELQDRLKRDGESLDRFELTRLRTSREMSPLLARAEVLVRANLGDWAKLALDEFDRALSADFLMESNVGAYVYLTRLHYSHGNYLRAIDISTKLAKASPGFWRQWPEQLFIYFPRPYREIYDANANETSLERELLLAISRRESGFTADIKSGANALGIMQLIRPTAERFAAEAGFIVEGIDTRLHLPGVNIKIGSRYLKWLHMNYNGFPPSVFGAYNAGEYPMDRWLQRRAHTDPLAFVELVPFMETKDYVKSVWRNVLVYRFLAGSKVPPAAIDLARPAPGGGGLGAGERRDREIPRRFD